MLELIGYIYAPFLLFSAIFSLKSFRLKWPLEYRYFSVLLWLMLFTELVAFAWSFWLYKTAYWSFLNHNTWVYNLFIIPQYLLLQIFYKIILGPDSKKSLQTIIAVFLLFALINTCFIQGIFTLNSYTIVLGNIITLLMALRYFHTIKDDVSSPSLQKNPLAWISIGVFINHSVNIPNTLGISYPEMFPDNVPMVFFYISLFVNCLMFLFFIIAYKCKPLQHN